MMRFLITATTTIIVAVNILLFGTTAAANATTPPPQTVLVIVLHNAQGQPLAGVTCEVLSYDWGLKMGQADTVIARGETDLNGSVSFDNSVWPHSGYRFRFRPTNHTEPAATYFLPESQNQYRGYPGAVVGGRNDTEYFAIGSDGLPYNDLASGQGMPNIQKDPVGGLQQPRVTIMPSRDYFATVRAQTATAYAGGAPIPVTPAPPPTFNGIAEPALSITPQAGAVTTTVADKSSNTASNGVGFVGPTPPQTQAGTPAAATTAQPDSVYVSKPGQGSSTTLFMATLATVGLVSFLIFWRYRHAIYARLGIEVIAPRPRPRPNKHSPKRQGLFAASFRKGAAAASRSKPKPVKTANDTRNGETNTRNQQALSNHKDQN